MDEWVRQAHVWASQAESWAHQQPSEQVYIATAVVAVTILVLIPASYLKSLAPL
jgi:signal recognition particle receptor subunit beta